MYIAGTVVYLLSLLIVVIIPSITTPPDSFQYRMIVEGWQKDQCCEQGLSGKYLSSIGIVSVLLKGVDYGEKLLVYEKEKTDFSAF